MAQAPAAILYLRLAFPSTARHCAIVNARTRGPRGVVSNWTLHVASDRIVSASRCSSGHPYAVPAERIPGNLADLALTAGRGT